MKTSYFKTFALVFATLFAMVLTGCEKNELNDIVSDGQNEMISDQVTDDAPRVDHTKIESNSIDYESAAGITDDIRPGIIKPPRPVFTDAAVKVSRDKPAFSDDSKPKPTFVQPEANVLGPNMLNWPGTGKEKGQKPVYTASEPYFSEAPRAGHAVKAEIFDGDSFSSPLEVAIVIAAQNENIAVLQAYNLSDSDDLMFQSGYFTIIWYQNGKVIGSGPIIEVSACGEIAVEVLDKKGKSQAKASINLGLCQVTLNDKK